MERYHFPSLSDVAETLHEHVTGSSEALPQEQELEVYEFLKMRIRDWQPTNLSAPVESREYDLAVWRLVQAAIAEYEASHWAKPKATERQLHCECGGTTFIVQRHPRQGISYLCVGCGKTHPGSTAIVGNP